MAVSTHAIGQLVSTMSNQQDAISAQSRQDESIMADRAELRIVPSAEGDRLETSLFGTGL